MFSSNFGICQKYLIVQYFIIKIEILLVFCCCIFKEIPKLIKKNIAIFLGPPVRLKIITSKENLEMNYSLLIACAALI